MIPETKNCDGCIKIETMQFQTSQNNNRLSELEKKIESLEYGNRKIGLKADEQKIKEFRLDSSSAVLKMTKQFAEFKLDFPHRYPVLLID